MYTYVVSTQTYISEKHADNEDYSDEEYEETQMTYHLKKMWFVANSVKEVFEIVKTYDFGEPVEWYNTEKNITEEFELIRRISPERPNMTITQEIGWILENPNRIREFITITQVPLINIHIDGS